MVIYLDDALQQVATTALERVFLKAIGKMGGVEEFAFGIDPCAENQNN